SGWRAARILSPRKLACFLDGREVGRDVWFVGPVAQVPLVTALAHLTTLGRIALQAVHSCQQLVVRTVGIPATALLYAFGKTAPVTDDRRRVLGEGFQGHDAKDFVTHRWDKKCDGP